MGNRPKKKRPSQTETLRILADSKSKEDAIDLKAVKDRAHEPSRSFETVLKNLRSES